MTAAASRKATIGLISRKQKPPVGGPDGELSFEVIGKMETPCPTPLSAMRELAVDGHSFVAAYVNFKSRLLKPLATREMGPDFWTTRSTDMLQA